MKIGDKVHKPLTNIFSGDKDAPTPRFWGCVVWIHPQGRFYVAAFSFPGGTIRECFREGYK